MQPASIDLGQVHSLLSFAPFWMTQLVIVAFTFVSQAFSVQATFSSVFSLAHPQIPSMLHAGPCLLWVKREVFVLN